jgi:hypothetical protein
MEKERPADLVIELAEHCRTNKQRIAIPRSRSNLTCDFDLYRAAKP